jgi:hypothetical protein
MKDSKSKYSSLLAVSLLLMCGVAMADDGEPPAQAPGAAASTSAADEAAALAKDNAEANAELAAMPAADRDMCLIPGKPVGQQGNYQTLRKLKVARQTYGSVVLVLPQLVKEARAAGADAIMDYNGSQRFGFWPWRLVRPVATGTAIKWAGGQPGDCASLGGTALSKVIATHKAPARAATK